MASSPPRMRPGPHPPGRHWPSLCSLIGLAAAAALDRRAATGEPTVVDSSLLASRAPEAGEHTEEVLLEGG